MTRIRSVCRCLGVLAPLAGIAGCEPQVGEEYSGDVSATHAKITGFPRSHQNGGPPPLQHFRRRACRHTEYQQFESVCTADGACLERTLACHEQACGEVVWQSDGFDPANATTIGSADFMRTHALFVKGYCTSLAELA
jgi:hypothetical protein